MTIDPANCTGFVSFLGLIKDQGMDCQRIRSVVQLKNVAIPLLDGRKMTRVSTTETNDINPIDIKQPRTSHSRTLGARFEAAARIGPPGHDNSIPLSIIMKEYLQATQTHVGK
jgi:hypothetical protein